MTARTTWWALGPALVGLAAAAYGLMLIHHGFSARDEPSRLESVIATSVRRLSIPSAAKQRENPFGHTSEVLGEAMQHFADHCASCHGTDGAGQTQLGRSLYPRAPDMRAPGTQDQSDGELHYVIQNGVRLSGMPAFGELGDDTDSWKLVQLIRQFPRLTSEERKRMEHYLPKSAAELEAERAEEEFLGGAGTNPEQRPTPSDGGTP